MIDAHHHIWRLDRTPWLSGPPVPRIFGEYEGLRRDYLIEEFAADTGRQRVDASVYVQVNVAPGDETEEIAWASREGKRERLVQGTVAFADLSAAGLDDALDQLTTVTTLRGIRQQLHWHANPAYRFAPRPDVMLDPAWQRGLVKVTARGLLFELQVFPAQLADARSLVQAFPDTQFVLLHAGMLEDRSASGIEQWRDGMRRLADCPNVAVKLSGLGTFVRRCTVADWRPVVRATLEAFGAERSMFGSNFPIERLWTTYDELVEVMLECLSDLSATERDDVLSATARRLYQLA